MKIHLEPTDIPFMIGDTVWVDQACGDKNQYPCFQATIIQIILDGSLTNSIVIRERTDVHQLLISNGIYDLKPIGDRAGLSRITVIVDFFGPKRSLFATQSELIDYTSAKKPPLLVAEQQDGRV